MTDATFDIKISLDETQIKKDISSITKQSEKELLSSFSRIVQDIERKISSSAKIDLTINQESINEINNKLNEIKSQIKGTSASFSIDENFIKEFSKLNETIVLLNNGISSSVKELDRISQNKIAQTNVDFKELEATISTSIVKANLFEGSISGLTEKVISFGKAVFLAFGIFSSGLVALIPAVLLKVSLGFLGISNTLIDLNKKTSDVFIQLNSQIEITRATIDNFNKVFDGQVGSFNKYNGLINEISKSFNLLEKDLLKASQEIVQVGSQLGLNEKQLKSLIKISAEYAKINGKDVFDTSVAFASALNGNTQALVSYGVKLNEVNLQQTLNNLGIQGSVNNLTEASKVQLRFNSILNQYSKVAGLGIVASNTLADATNKLNVTQEVFLKNFGEGSAIIENNNIVTKLFVDTINLIPESLTKTIGFFSALAARALQLVSSLAILNFATFSFQKSVSILNIFLSSSNGFEIFGKQISVATLGLNNLFARLGAGTVQIKSASDLFSSFGKVLTNAGTSFTGLAFASNGFFSIIKKFAISSIGSLRSAFALIAPVVSPLIGKFALITGAIIIAQKVFDELSKIFTIVENKTKFLSNAAETLRLIFIELTGPGSIIDTAKKFFIELGEEAARLGSVLQGRLAQGIVKLGIGLNELVASNPFGLFSDQVVASSQKSIASLKAFENSLRQVSFDVRQLSEESSRSIADTGDKTIEFVQRVSEGVDPLVEKLNLLNEQYKNFGLTDLEVLQLDFDEKLKLINEGLEKELLTRQQFENLFTKITEDANQKRNQIVNKSLIELNKSLTNQLQNGATRIVSESFAFIGRTLVGFGEGFKGFTGLILGLLGDLAISIGTTVIASSKAIAALKASIAGSPGAAIVLGGALIAIGAALKGLSSSLGGGASSSGGGGGGGGFVPSPSLPSGTTDFQDDRNEDAFGFNGNEERQEEKPRISLTVNGDVLDSEETGLRIARLLNDTFQRDGVVLNQPLGLA